MANTKFEDMFGKDAFVQRPNETGFTVLSKPSSEKMAAYDKYRAQFQNEEIYKGTGGDDGVPAGQEYVRTSEGTKIIDPPPGNTAWKYDAKTQTYANPETGKQVSVADMGIKDPVTASFEVGRLASLGGKNIDSWSAYGPAKSSEKYGTNAEEYRGALTNDFRKIRAYEAKGGMLDKVIDYAPMAIMMVSGFGAALGNLLTQAGMNATLASVASGAASGALSSAASGGNIAKGALMGGAGGAIGSVTSNLEGGANFTGPVQDSILSTSNIASAVGSAGLAAATGGNTGAALVGSLAGSGVRNLTGSGAAGTIASKATGLLMADDNSSTTATQSGSMPKQGLIDPTFNDVGNVTPTSTTQPVTIAPVTPPTATAAEGGGMYGFGHAVPIGYQVVNRRDMNWGKRGV